MRILDKWGLQQRFRMRLHVCHVWGLPLRSWLFDK